MRLDNIAEVKDKELTTKGSVYLVEEWLQGTIYTSSGHKIPDVPLKYDLKNNLFEIDFPDGIKVLGGQYVKQFEMMEGNDSIRSEFVNASMYNSDGLTNTGFLKVLVKGERAALLKRYELQQVPPNYSATMDVGSKNGAILISEKLYLAVGNLLAELKGRNNYSSFGEFEDEVKSYARKYKLKLHKEEDAISVVNFFNTLL
ncbi:hypothetical protein [Pontibacter pudoricolor]|uniref:hypothetical protein n=1 Tax=Pontibacter pudoricolor TaxID=2694930 RepID=UPI0013914222|nr:hypothetical protein [Pontibacter pudoricolor]